MVASIPHLTARNRLIPSKSVEAASLHRYRPALTQLQIFPFVFIVYPATICLWATGVLESREIIFVTSISAVALNALVWLITEWNVTFKCFSETFKTNDVYVADVIRVIPISTRGAGTLCRIHRERNASSEDGYRIYFIFQRRKYLYDCQLGVFHRLAYPVSPLPPGTSERALCVKEYLASNGIDDADSVIDLYGRNEFEVPIPKFAELLREHAVAPFFVFQVFCVVLWSMDEYWYYSGFTLLMLVAFESALVQQRLKTLNELRNMSLKPYNIWVYRNRRWTQVQTDDLLPGDVCSVSDTDEEHPVPADMLLLRGTCIMNEAMLSGESTPLFKEAADSLSDQEAVVDIHSSKTNILYGGTKVLQVYPESCSAAVDVDVRKSICGLPSAPDSGAICYVLRTGFGTSQGGLVRLMIYSSGRVTAANKESLLFILFLLVFALVASGYVLYHGLQDPLRSRGKLALDCMLIITSVVPPELPMELSMAVNTSLAKLVKEGIYCTEPFRIPFAGKIDFACFDKTGTITGDQLKVEGVVLPDALVGFPQGEGGMSDAYLTRNPQALTRDAILSMACCQGLIKLNQMNKKAELAGDPMESAAFAFLGWDIVGKDTAAPLPTPGANAASSIKSARIEKRFHFSSALKRMTTVSSLHGSNEAGLYVAVKGAPETIKRLLQQEIPHYDDTFKHFARKGSRVIALACRRLHSDVKVTQLPPREKLESGLTFAGFLVLSCPLKPDSTRAIEELSHSSHRVVMITGDNPLTACHVSKEVGITKRTPLILDVWDDDKVPMWRTMEETEVFEAESDLVGGGYDFCVTGKALERLMKSPWFLDMATMVHVWARVSPIQKEFILTQIKSQGKITMMCGDGTNDVGALKQADVGVAVLDGTKEDLEKIALNDKLKRVKEMYAKQKSLAQKLKMPAPPMPPVLKKLEERKVEREKERGANNGQSSRAKKTKEEQRREFNEKQYHNRMSGILSKLEEMEEDASSVPVLKFGDASIAAPFTSKLGSLVTVNSIIKQGRCTLVTTHQMYKILALNCLITAYSLSVLYLDGIKWGDWQLTVQGMLIGICFLFVSRGKPLDKLSKERPLSNIFNAYTLLSVLGQFGVHAMCLLFVTFHAKRLMSEQLEFDYTGDREFAPNLLNSGVYLLSLTMQCCTFVINYQGRPFRENISENRVLYRGLAAVALLSFVGSMELYVSINEWLQLVPLPASFSVRLTLAMAFDWVGCYGVDKGLRWLLLRKS